MKFLLSIALIGMCHVFFAQSNNPCGAPSLLPSLICLNTLGSTIGASYENNNANGGTPSCGNPGNPDVWYSFTAPLTGGVTITTSNGTITNGAMALYTGNCNSLTQVQCNSNANNSNMPEITNLSLVPGQVYYIRFWKNGNGSSTGTFNICIKTRTPPIGNSTCANPSPICSGSPINFTANVGGTPATSVNPSNDYGCLGTSPNPSWYYLRIATGGNLVIDIVAGSDVDYAIWGPFASLPTAQASCNSYGDPIDCSYSTAATEQVNVPGVTSGQVYILLVTNFANTIQNITVNQSAANTATTDCSIVPLPVGYTQFSAESDVNGVFVKWTTESEQNNDYFIVQRSKTGTFWESLGIVQGKGNSDQENHYSFLDKQPVEGISYYRLVQVDFNGVETTSDITSITREVQSKISVFPNPAKSKFSIRNYGSKISQIQLSNLQGRPISIDSNMVNDEFQIDCSFIPNGNYILTLTLENGLVETKRITILN